MASAAFSASARTVTATYWAMIFSLNSDPSFEVHPLPQISKDRDDEQLSRSRAKLGERQLDIDLGAFPVEGGDTNRVPHDPGFACFHVAAEPRFVRRAEARRHYRRERLTDEVKAGATEQPFSGRVRVENQAARVGGQDRVVEGVEHALEGDRRYRLRHRLTAHVSSVPLLHWALLPRTASSVEMILPRPAPEPSQARLRADRAR